MDYPKEMNAIMQEVLLKSQLAKLLVMNLKKQGKRFLTLLAKYNSLANTDGLLAKAKDMKFGDIEEYSNLISRQFSGRIEEFSDKITKFKLETEKLSNDVKARPTQDHKDRLEKVRQKLKDFDEQLTFIWKQQHFLALNYRLDICAKQLQRWTSVMESNRFSEDKIKENIENLFK